MFHVPCSCVVDNNLCIVCYKYNTIERNVHHKLTRIFTWYLLSADRNSNSKYYIIYHEVVIPNDLHDLYDKIFVVC